MQIKFKKLTKNAVIPSYALEHDAGMDIYCSEPITVEPGDRKLISTGIASEFDPGYVVLIWDKSGISNNRGLKVLGGVIDAGFRGEWKICLHNLGNQPQSFEVGDKVAQGLIQAVIEANVVEVEELGTSMRQENGFGSTGK